MKSSHTTKTNGTKSTNTTTAKPDTVRIGRETLLAALAPDPEWVRKPATTALLYVADEIRSLMDAHEHNKSIGGEDDEMENAMFRLHTRARATAQLLAKIEYDAAKAVTS